MQRTSLRSLVAAVAIWLAGGATATAEPIRIVAAENFYGDAARAVGGARVDVLSVMAGGVDPHEYEPPPSVARAVADAAIVIMNGAAFDPWMTRLLVATPNQHRVVIDVAALAGRADGGNPHVWHDPAAMPAAARALADALITIDPTGEADFMRGRDSFLASLAPIADEVARLREAYAGTTVAATEPVYGPMLEALGLQPVNWSFQAAIMIGIEPAPSELAAMVDDLRNRRVKVLFYNTQVRDSFTDAVVAQAEQAGVPVVGVTETQPEGKTFATWMLDQLGATAQALRAQSR